MAENVVADLTELGRFRIGPGFIGRSVFVTSEDAWYEALLEGEGADKWQARIVAGQSAIATGRVNAVSRTFTFSDPDIAVDDTTVSIDLGSELPAGSIALCVIAATTSDWTDGGASVFAGDVGFSGGDLDALTPTEINLDGGASILTQSVALPCGGETFAFTVTGDVDLSTLTGGVCTVTILHCTPVTTTVEPPEE